MEVCRAREVGTQVRYDAVIFHIDEPHKLCPVVDLTALAYW